MSKKPMTVEEIQVHFWSQIPEVRDAAERLGLKPDDVVRQVQKAVNGSIFEFMNEGFHETGVAPKRTEMEVILFAEQKVKEAVRAL